MTIGGDTPICRMLVLKRPPCQAPRFGPAPDVASKRTKLEWTKEDPMPSRRGSSSLKNPKLYEELGLTGYSGKRKAELISMLRNH